MQHFSEDEILLVDEVIRTLWSQNATQVSDASHDIRWRVLQHKDRMPYEFAFLDDYEITKNDIERTAELAREPSLPANLDGKGMEHNRGTKFQESGNPPWRGRMRS